MREKMEEFLETVCLRQGLHGYGCLLDFADCREKGFPIDYTLLMEIARRRRRSYIVVRRAILVAAKRIYDTEAGRDLLGEMQEQGMPWSFLSRLDEKVLHS